jgi:hypothetical protein
MSAVGTSVGGVVIVGAGLEFLCECYSTFFASSSLVGYRWMWLLEGVKSLCCVFIMVVGAESHQV